MRLMKWGLVRKTVAGRYGITHHHLEHGEVAGRRARSKEGSTFGRDIQALQEAGKLFGPTCLLDKGGGAVLRPGECRGHRDGFAAASSGGRRHQLVLPKVCCWSSFTSVWGETTFFHGLRIQRV